MNRSLKLSMLVALALGSSQVMALNLGQVQIKSALGQPLLAEIPVHPASPAELQNLSVQLASSEEFARAGITDGRTTIPLHFSVVNGAGGKVIRITSSQNVDNPYLDLLLEVHSKAGKSVREVAILLDPATSTPSPAPAPVVAVAKSPAAHARTKAAASTSTRAPAPATHAATPVATAPSLNNGHYGPVKQGETLSSIARSTAPTGVDMAQMLLALKQANPDAFYHDNINALKSGAVLRVPTAAEAQAMTIAAAVAEVRRQNSDWRAGTPGKTAVVADAGTRSSASSAPANASTGTGDRLALVPAKAGNSAAGTGGNAAGKGDKSAASLRQDLLRSQESLASLQEQSSDLKARLKDLSGINDKNVHLLSLKDSEIAELQAKLAAARKTAGMPAAPAASAPAPLQQALAKAGSTAVSNTPAKPATTSSALGAMAAPATTSSAATAANASSTAPAASSTTAVAAPSAVKPIVKPAAKPVAETGAAPSAEQPWYMQTWAWAAGAGAIVLLILLALLGRRRKPTSAAAAKTSKSSASLADRFTSTTAPAAPTGNITGDDVDQEDLLDQLAEHPDDIYLHLELVTLYYSRRDVDHFEAAAEAMHAHITDPQQDEWQDVLHMGEDLAPGHPLFDHHPELPADEAAAARSEFNIDDYADKNDTAKATPPSPPSPPPLPSSDPKKVSEYNFNFDLTNKPAATTATDQPSTAQKPAASAPPAVATHAADVSPAAVDEPAPDWHFSDTANGLMGDDHAHAADDLMDDPVDTKLDLARAYLDMGDSDGARAMLDEVIKEGSKMQQDTAKQLLGNLH